MSSLVLTPGVALARGLGRHGEAVALVADGEPVSYADLDRRVADRSGRLGPVRRLVALRMANDLRSVVDLLACLRGGHPVVLLDPSRPAEDLCAAYDVDVVLGETLEERRPGTAHDLHPDLALLLSTSGSTGSPKLVRLSAASVDANALAIGHALGIGPDDVAVTTLPLHYSYGLSVLTSHLAVGATVALTSESVLDEGLWRLMERERVTTLPAVPHTVALLERCGFADRVPAGLRTITVAGGRLAPEAVVGLAELGRRHGFGLAVMYGATEATARMTVLPPDLALTHPGSVGYAVPGSRMEVVEGELVLTGPQVMLGYAERPADLARGREVVSLRTGDLGEVAADGLVTVTGRRARRAKPLGVRVDLDHVERLLLDDGVVALVADGGGRLVVGVDVSARPAPDGMGRDLSRRLGLPPSAVVVVGLVSLPRLPNGKPDYAALRAAADERHGGSRPDPSHEPAQGEPARARELAERLAGELSEVLGRPVGLGESFARRGGDSLTYVEASLRVERVLGRLPSRWPSMTPEELAATATATATATASGGREPGRRGWWRRRSVETNVLMRAAAIVAIVGSHANLFTLLGGAHVLVGLAGYNFGRFAMTDRPRRERTRALGASLGRVLVPSVLWLAFAAATSEKYTWRNVVLLNGVLGSRAWSEPWHYWFVEALVWTLVGLMALTAIPWVDRAERRWPFGLPMTLVAAGLLTRYDVWRLFEGDRIHRAHVLFWLFALGWAAVKAQGTPRPVAARLLVSVAAVLTVPGFFPGEPGREAVVVTGLLLLVWVPSVGVPDVVARVAGVLASASLFVYLVHWQVYPAYEFSMPWLATSLSVAAGVAFWWAYGRVAGHVRGEIDRGCRRLSPRRCPVP